MTTNPYLISERKRYNAASLKALLERLQRASALAVFIGTALLLWWMYGHRLILSTNDEGIYLDGAERILHGQKLYVDFFGYMSPGSFWMQALAFRLFGVTLPAGRAPVIVYIALECALIYWLVELYSSRAFAIVTTLIFLAFETADTSMITAQHRWDSSALALASIAICVVSQIRASPRWLVASGIIAAAAALATPSVALVATVTLAWLAWPADRRMRAAWYLIGLFVAASLAALALWLDGIFPAFLGQLQWLSRNYSDVNVMHYGSIIGGYRALFEGAGAWELPIRCCVVFCIALPAVLPVFALAGGAALWARRPGPNFSYLLLCVVALVLSTYPRSDVAHLAYVAALPYAVASILVHRLLPAWPRAWIGIFIGIWAIVFACQAQLPGELRTLRTPVGDVRVSAADAPLVGELLARVQPHQSLFVYPYKPLLYFLTQAENPTRYSYVQPGLMTGEDAKLILSELKARPPDWVLYMDLNQAEFERVFPSGKNFAVHFPALEGWIKANYRSSGGVPLGGYVLLRHSTSSSSPR